MSYELVYTSIHSSIIICISYVLATQMLYVIVIVIIKRPGSDLCMVLICIEGGLCLKSLPIYQYRLCMLISERYSVFPVHLLVLKENDKV